MGGGAIEAVFSSSSSSSSFSSFDSFLAFETRSAISTLASVVSEGSPGSSPFVIFSPVADRNRLEGGLSDDELGLGAFAERDSGAVVSSPDASRDVECSCSTAGVFLVEEGRVEVRFLLPAEDGEDMMNVAEQLNASNQFATFGGNKVAGL